MPCVAALLVSLAAWELATNDGLDALVWHSQYCCSPESHCNSRRTTASPWHLADESTRAYLGLAAGCSTSSLTAELTHNSGLMGLCCFGLRALSLGRVETHALSGNSDRVPSARSAVPVQGTRVADGAVDFGFAINSNHRGQPQMKTAIVKTLTVGVAALMLATATGCTSKEPWPASMRPMLLPRLLRKMPPPQSRLPTLPPLRPRAPRTPPALPRARRARPSRRPRVRRPAATRRTRRSIARSRSRWASKPTDAFAQARKRRRGESRGVFFARGECADACFNNLQPTYCPADAPAGAHRRRQRYGHAGRLQEGTLRTLPVERNAATLARFR